MGLQTELPADLIDTAGHTLYDPRKSSTSRNVTDSKWYNYYLANTGASSYYGTDSVTISGVTASNQVIKLATQVIGVMSNLDGCDGKRNSFYSAQKLS